MHPLIVIDVPFLDSVSVWYNSEVVGTIYAKRQIYIQLFIFSVYLLHLFQRTSSGDVDKILQCILKWGEIRWVYSVTVTQGQIVIQTRFSTFAFFVVKIGPSGMLGWIHRLWSNSPPYRFPPGHTSRLVQPSGGHLLFGLLLTTSFQLHDSVQVKIWQCHAAGLQTSINCVFIYGMYFTLVEGVWRYGWLSLLWWYATIFSCIYRVMKNSQPQRVY